MNATLSEIYERHRTNGMAGHGDKGSVHSYIRVYEKLLAPYRAGCTLMEVGIAKGLSLAMWREYMPNSMIIGVDLGIVFDPKPHTETGTILIVADATKPSFLDNLKGYHFDVVIDDASHLADDQRQTFRLLKSMMNTGGIYVIEDVLALEQERGRFASLHRPMDVYDLRSEKGYFADVLIVYRF